MNGKDFFWTQSLAWMGLVLLASCAQVSAPTGGPKDATPPVLLRSVPQNGSVGISPERVRFEFDEYILTKNVTQQLLISPPIEEKPELRVRGKSVEVILKPKSFLDQTTYVFSFGDAIVDLHEGNPAVDLVYAFSTGDRIDSLRIKGRVTDRMTHKGTPNLRVLLHLNPVTWDTIWGGKTPDAVAMTDADGWFEAGYLSEGSFRAFALEDENRDYVWNPGEALALSGVEMNAGDSLELPWLLTSTLPTVSDPYLSSAMLDSSGFVRVLAPTGGRELRDSWRIIEGGDTAQMHVEWLGDSAFLWTEQPRLWNEPLLIWNWQSDYDGQGGSDTIALRWERKAMTNQLHVQTSWKAKESATAERQITFDRPLMHVDAALWSWMEDSLWMPLESSRIAIGSSDSEVRMVHIETRETDGASIALRALPRSVTSREGWTLSDTLILKWKTHPLEHYGSLIVEAENIPGSGWFLCESVGDVTPELPAIYCQRDTAIAWKRLLPGSYRVSFKWDENADGIWQSIDPYQQQLPERYMLLPEMVDVRSNWDMEIIWNLGAGNLHE